jgi:hypothetical protein
LAHQVCLTHSHPPSHLDRNRKGLAYLSSYGWDPDARVGLGASGQGIQYPIKSKPKDDKLGIGVVLPKEADRRKKEKVEKLDAGKIRKLHEKDKKKAERLRVDMLIRVEVLEKLHGKVTKRRRVVYLRRLNKTNSLRTRQLGSCLIRLKIGHYRRSLADRQESEFQ